MEKFTPYSLIETLPGTLRYEISARSPVDLSPAEPILAFCFTSSEGEKLCFWNFDEHKTIAEIFIQDASIDKVAFSPDGYLIFLWTKQTVKVYQKPWGNVPLFEKELGQKSHKTMTWLENNKLLLAMNNQDNLDICLIDLIMKRFTIIFEINNDCRESGDSNFGEIACSPSGLVIYAKEHDQFIQWYKFDKDFEYINYKGDFLSWLEIGIIRSLCIDQDENILAITVNSSYAIYIKIEHLENALPSPPTWSVPKWEQRENLQLKCCSQIFMLEKIYDSLDIYYLTNGSIDPWCTIPIRDIRDVMWSAAFRNIDNRFILALVMSTHILLYELRDKDIIGLYDEDATIRERSAKSLGERRLPNAILPLVDILRDAKIDVQEAAIGALGQMSETGGDTDSEKAIREMIRLLGSKPGEPLENCLFNSLVMFPKRRLIPVVEECFNFRVAYRRGAAYFIYRLPSIGKTDVLCKALHDADTFVRTHAAQALGKRRSLKACGPLLSYLCDANEEFRNAVIHAINNILRAHKFIDQALAAPESHELDHFVKEVIRQGMVRGWDLLENQQGGQFLIQLAKAVIVSKYPLPNILNSIELLVNGATTANFVNNEIGLVLGIICADFLRQMGNPMESATLYKAILELSQRIHAPQIEWRLWKAIGECWMIEKDDKQAWGSFQNAMQVIDRMWLVLLDEDKLRNFFQDKACLYDQASACCLRLGYVGEAIECIEKAKTRYLGDLIARRQLINKNSLVKETDVFWKEIQKLRSVLVEKGTTREISGRQELTVVFDELQSPDSSFIPEFLHEFWLVSKQYDQLGKFIPMIKAVWKLVAYVVKTGDEEVLENLEAIYQVLAPIQTAVRSAFSIISLEERNLAMEQYKEAAQKLEEIKLIFDNERLPTYAFNQWRDWLDMILINPTENDPYVSLFNAVMEALNAVLSHDRIYYVPTDDDFDRVKFLDPRLTFITGVPVSEGEDDKQSLAAMDSVFEQFSRSRWRYLAQLMRGEIISYQEILRSLSDQTGLAQLYFSVSQYGTSAYVLYGQNSPTFFESAGEIPPDLKGEVYEQVFTFPEITQEHLHKLLKGAENSWFGTAYQRGQGSWEGVMDPILKELYAKLIAPLLPALKRHHIKHLRIIPHRALNLIPFGALFREDDSGRRHYLIDDFSVEYAPSATLLNICRQRKARPRQDNLLAVSNPTGDLHYADLEVTSIVGTFTTSKPMIIQGERAKPQKVRSEIPRNAYFHFAGHSQFNWDDPLESDLRFAFKEKLTLADLLTEPVSLGGNKLVVLSSCESNVTDPDDLADEYLGISSGFLFGGSPLILSSLWRVDDLAAALLMSRFYQAMREEKKPARVALQIAQRWLRQLRKGQTHKYMLRGLTPNNNRILKSEMDDDYLTGEIDLLYPYRHPRFWAAFVLVGDSR
jgi:CHAT domain-containing protein/HEAT repeat protein